MPNSITVSYAGTKERLRRIKALAILKNVHMGELIADAVDKVYGDELQAVDVSFVTMNDHLNGHAPKRARKQNTAQN